MSEEAVPSEVGNPAPEGGSPASRRLPWGRWLVVTCVAGILAILGGSLARASASQVDRGPAPDFELTTFDGQLIRLSDQRGKVVVINFWASWCIPCREEAPVLEATWRDYRESGVVFIGVDYLDNEREALAYIEEFDLTYPNGPDLRTRIAQAYRIQGVPETFFVDRSGMLRGVHIGPITEAQLVSRIETLLAPGGLGEE